MSPKFYIIITILIILGTLVAWQQKSRDSFNLPKEGAETQKEIIITKNGKMAEKEIFVTDGTKHSVPLDEITGLLPKDQIPPIDNPKFISTEQANNWLKDNEPGIAFSRGSTNRFYPYQILVWHEIVNDTVEGKRILVTYCPLCLTGFVFDPLVDGERVEFGTSGKLWKSNLILYDRKTESLWSQILGEAIVGKMTGAQLKTIPSDQMLYGNWKKQFPSGKILSRDTGAKRFYGSNPYKGYFVPEGFALRMAGLRDSRIPPETFVLGIVVGEKAKAYSVDSVKKQGVVEDTFENIDIVLRHDKTLDVVRVFKKLPDGTEERINPFSAFWFSWSAAHPNTELYD